MGNSRVAAMLLRLRPRRRPWNLYSANFRLFSTQSQAMNVEIICKEMIKPAFRTPHRMKTYKLSLLDQVIAPRHFPLVFFYPNNQHTNQIDVIRKHLKQSLSKTLAHFYALAGKIKDDLWIDCNDEGAYYVEARVNCHLSKLLSQPNYQLVHQLVPHVNPTETEPIAGVHVLMIQLNIFECGGTALTLCTSHKITDGCTVETFLKAWRAYACGFQEVIHPSFIASSIFPQNILLPKDSRLFMWPALFKESECVTRRFVFDASALASLKHKAASSSFVQNPTRIEVVSGIIWKCTSKARHGFEKPSVFSFVVDLRRKMFPNLLAKPIGNLLWLAVAQCMSSTEVELHSLVGCLRKAKERINNDFIQELQGDKGFLKVSEYVKELGELYSKKGVDSFFSSSFCRSSVYEADFGWGKPIWVIDGTAGRDDQSFHLLLMDTKLGDGIEAWVSLNKQEMAKLEQDPEILAFASLDPSPLKLAGVLHDNDAFLKKSSIKF